MTHQNDSEDGSGDVIEEKILRDTKIAKRLLWVLLLLLLASVASYVALHFVYPPEGQINDSARSRQLARSIDQAREAILVSSTFALLSEVAKLTESAIPERWTELQGRRWYGDFEKKLRAASNLARTRAIGLIGEAGTTADSMQEVSNNDSARRILELIKKETSTKGEIGSNRPNLWTIDQLLLLLHDEILGRWQFNWDINWDRLWFSDRLLIWVELFFWAWLGTLTFLISEVAKWYPYHTPGRDFAGYWPWYIANMLKCPITALLILAFLIFLRIEILGVKFPETTGSPALWILLAAVLGFFGRVARIQLEIIIEKIFPTAWLRATSPPIRIEPATARLQLGSSMEFAISPDQNVLWSTIPDRCGQILQSGRFTAPQDPEFAGKEIIIRATSVVNRGLVAEARVDLEAASSTL